RPRYQCVHATWRPACLEKHRRARRARAVSLHPGRGRRVDRRAATDGQRLLIDDRNRAGRDAAALGLEATRTVAAIDPRSSSSWASWDRIAGKETPARQAIAPNAHRWKVAPLAPDES